MYAGLIGRRAELSAVKYAILQMESRASSGLKVRDYPNIFYIYGPVGVGKTTLMQTVFTDCEQGELGFQPLSIWFDCSRIAQSEATAEESFVVELSRAAVATEPQMAPLFEPVFDYWNHLSEAILNQNSSASAPSTTANPRINPVKAAYGSIANIPVKKSPSGQQNVKDIARSVTRNMQAMEAAQRTPPIPAAVNSKVEIVKLFAQAIDQISGHFRVVIFIDNYETFERSDDWFRQTFLKAFQKELIVVIAGETDLHKSFLQDFGNVVHCFQLNHFNVFETGQLLAFQNQINDPKIVVAAHRLGGGNPLCTAMIAAALHHINTQDTSPSSSPQARLFTLQMGGNLDSSQSLSPALRFLAWPGDDYGDKINKYIAYIMMDELPPNDQNLLIILALMNRFHPELFQHLSGAMHVSRTLEHLSQRYRFVSPQGEMSRFMKNTLRGYTKQEMEHLFEETMHSAYEFMAAQVQQHPEDLNVLIDAMYYYFHLDFRVAYQHYVNLISHYMHSNLDFCDRLAAEMLSCSIPQEVKHKIRSMARSLGWYRKRDPKGSQFIMAEIAHPQAIDNEEMRFVADLFLLSDHS